MTHSCYRIIYYHFLTLLFMYSFSLSACNLWCQKGGKNQEKHLVKRDYFEDQVITEVKGREQGLSPPFFYGTSSLSSFYKQLTIFKKILNFLLKPFCVSAFESWGDVTFRSCYTLISRHFRKHFSLHSD